MMYKAWSRIGEVPYWFSRSSVKFQGRNGQNIADFEPNWAFPDRNSRLNSLMALKWCTKLNIVQNMCPIVFQGHPSNFKVTRLKKIIDFDRNWAFPDCNSSLHSPMGTKWCTKLEDAQERCTNVSKGHLSNFKVTREKKLPILTWI